MLKALPLDFSKYLDMAVAGSSNGIFKNSGQVCIAGSRIIVEKSIADEFTDKMIKNADSLKVGNPLDLSTDIGAISNKNQLKKNLEYVKTAIKEGGAGCSDSHGGLQA